MRDSDRGWARQRSTTVLMRECEMEGSQHYFWYEQWLVEEGGFRKKAFCSDPSTLCPHGISAMKATSTGSGSRIRA